MANAARSGKKVATDGTVGGKNGKVLLDGERLHAATLAVAAT
jgi:hypothetical protein